MQQQPIQLGPKRCNFGGIGEVAASLSPSRDLFHDPIDDLTQRPFAFVGAELTTEVLLGDDVRCIDRPVDGELHAALFKDDAAICGIGQQRVALLPLDLIIWVNALDREVSTQSDRELFRCQCHECMPSILTPTAGLQPGEGGCNCTWHQVAPERATSAGANR